VPTGVLQPVVRRRRSPRRLRALLVAAAAAVAAGGVLAYEHHSSSPTAVASPPPRTTPHHAAKRTPAPARRIAAPLLVSAPVHRHTFTPRIAARAAIVVDRNTGRVLWALRPHRRLPIASTTKIMTAVLALEHLRANTVVRVSPTVTRVPLVKEGLRPRERVRAWKLFDGLLMYSGNDDALALAIATAGTRRGFISRMNDEARTLGLRDTHFASPSGVIDRENYSSAWDLAALARYAMRKPRFRHIVRTRIAHVPWSPPTYEKVYINKNALLGSYRGADGVKTGWTTLAGHCLVASATRGGRSAIVVVLHDGNEYGDARRLLTFGLQQ
jgi:D-alanyl-D-alanine carboxypeptidase (penicillin-binding protein 5/6)